MSMNNPFGVLDNNTCAQENVHVLFFREKPMTNQIHLGNEWNAYVID